MSSVKCASFNPALSPVFGLAVGHVIGLLSGLVAENQALAATTRGQIVTVEPVAVPYIHESSSNSFAVDATAWRP